MEASVLVPFLVVLYELLPQMTSNSNQFFSGNFWLPTVPILPPIHWYCQFWVNQRYWGEFPGPFSSKSKSILLKFWPEGVFHKAKTVFEESFKTMCLRGNWTYPKFKVLARFLGSIYPRKTQSIAKNQNFARNYTLRTIKQHNSQVL